MKEIKFKVWDVVNKRMIYLTDGSPIDNYDLSITSDDCILEFDNSEDAIKYLYQSKEEIIPLQFTGLKDKNGKEIYEGDIIKHEEELTYFIVVFYNGCFFLESVEDNEYNSSLDMTPIEIIGNIYENPELLEKF